MAITPYPAWVPGPVARYVESSLREPHDKPGRDRLRRLVEAPDMQSVWPALSVGAPEPDLLITFARQAAFSLWLSWGPRLLPASTPAKQRHRIRKIAQASRSLLNHLEALGDDQAERGAQFLASAVHRAELDAYKERRFEQIPRLAALAREPQWGHTAEVVSLLRTLHEVATVAAGAPNPPGPRKPRSRSAVRTAYVRELAGFVQQHFKKSHYAAVATTANVMLNEFEKPLTADHVRKLTLPHRKISGTKSR